MYLPSGENDSDDASMPAVSGAEANDCDVAIAEDEESFRVLLKVFLEAAGYSVVAFGNGAEALSYLRTHRVGLLVTDVFMPRVDGFELLRTLRHERRCGPIVAMSGSDLLDRALVAQIAHCFGVSRVLIKPFGLAEILDVVRAEVGDPWQ